MSNDGQEASHQGENSGSTSPTKPSETSEEQSRQIPSGVQESPKSGERNSKGTPRQVGSGRISDKAGPQTVGSSGESTQSATDGVDSGNTMFGWSRVLGRLIGAILALAFVRFVILSKAQVIGWKMFWARLFDGQTLELQFVLKTQTFWICVIGLAVGALSGGFLPRVFRRDA